MACYGRLVVQTESGKRVLVTGAGGWLGGEIAARLVASGAVVTALIRRRSGIIGNDGAPVPVARTLEGDLSAPLLGWTSAAWREQACQIDLIVHCAALTQFNADPALAHAINVTGTETVVALAAASGARLLHVSTAYVNGSRAGAVLESDAPTGPFTNAYEASKAAAERVVRTGGVPAVIARPSIVLGAWQTGAVREFGTFYYLLKAFAEGWVAQMPADPGATLDLVPVDHVAGGVLRLIERFDAAVGGTFHLVSGAPTPMAAFPQTLARFPGLAVPEFIAPDRFVAPPGRVFGRLIAPYAPYFRRNPRFDDRNFRVLTGLACPPVGPEWWERLVAFAIEAGFVGGAHASRSGPNGMASEAPMPSSAGSR